MEVTTNDPSAPADPNLNHEPGAVQGETPAETQLRKFRVKVDNEDLEVDEAELIKGYAHNKAASKRMQEAAKRRQEAEHVLNALASNPREAFKLLGMDARKFAEQLINEDLNEAVLTPDQRNQRDMRRQLEQYQAQERSYKEQAEQQERERQQQEYMETIQTDIIGALDASGLPKTSQTIGRFAYYMDAALRQGYEVKASDVAEFVKKDYVSDIQALMGGLSEDVIESFLGADISRKIAKSAVKKQAGSTPVPRGVNAPREPKKEKAVISPREFFDARRGR